MFVILHGHFLAIIIQLLIRFWITSRTVSNDLIPFTFYAKRYAHKIKISIGVNLACSFSCASLVFLVHGIWSTFSSVVTKTFMGKQLLVKTIGSKDPSLIVIFTVPYLVC